MVKPDVVAYLKEHLKQHTVEDLRRQLSSEGVCAEDFQDSLNAAMKAPSANAPSRGGVIFLILAALIIALIALSFSARRQDGAASPASGTVVAPSGTAAFVGRGGYVVALPKGYEAVFGASDERNPIELVHFCKKGTDPTNFLHEGLFGQMGIVRLQAQPNPFARGIAGIDLLTRSVTDQHTAAGEKFSVKNIQVSSLPGVQVTIELPVPAVETYILGETTLYRFLAGQDDEISRGIINSLRDPHGEAL
jgi:hypothetical protein